MREGERQRNRLKDASTPVDVFTVPMALGADHPGVDEGATVLDSALRKRLVRRGYPEISKRLQPARDIPVASLKDARSQPDGSKDVLHMAQIAEACDCLARQMADSLKQDHFSLTFGGDHALSIGSLAAASEIGRLGVIWVDAHGDINTPDTSPSGRVHGMPLSVALGHGPRQLVEVGSPFDLALEDLVYVGVRDLDPGERELLRQSPTMVYTIESVDRLTIDNVAQEAIRRLLERGVDAVHLSIDLDVLDPTVFAATGTPVPGGMTYRELRQLIVMLRESDLPIISADVVELNPQLDSDQRSTRVAAGLTATLLGELII